MQAFISPGYFIAIRADEHKSCNWGMPDCCAGSSPLNADPVLWAFISDFKVWSLGIRTADHESHNWGMQLIDGCSLELWVNTISLVSVNVCHRIQNQFNIAWLFRDGFHEKVFTFYIYITLKYIYIILHSTNIIFLYCMKNSDIPRSITQNS